MESEQFTEQIANSAEAKLTQSSRGMTYALQEQGGVQIAEDEALKLSPEMQTKVTSLLGITELTAQLRHSLFEQANKGLMTDSSKHSHQPTVIFNQGRFTRELLGNNPKLLDKLAEITAKAQILGGVLINQQQTDVAEELGVQAKVWEHTINEIAQSLCSNEEERIYYQKLVESNLVELNSPTETRESYAQRLGKLLQKPRAAKLVSAHLGSRQGEKLADNLIDEYLETAFTLNAVRVLDRVQRPLSFNGMFRKLISCLEGREANSLYTQIIEDYGLAKDFDDLNDQITQIHKSNLSFDEKRQKIKELDDKFDKRCLPAIERLFDDDTGNEEAVDIVGTKQKIFDLQQQAQELQTSNLSEAEKRQGLSKLDQQIQALFVPIANKVERIFPHRHSTNLTEVLENEEAVCAGKVNVLLAISKYLGVNARANSVKEVLDGRTEGHVCFECDLPSQNKLVIDANFSNIYGQEGKTDDELVARIKRNNPGIREVELESALKHAKLAIANSRFIPTNSRILIYTTENSSQVITNEQQLQEVRQNPRLLVRINPYSGQKEVWRANIPYPHLITSPDKNGYLFINSSFTNNTSHFIKPEYKDVGIYLFRKHIEMSPYDARAYVGLAGLLPQEEGLAFLEKTRREKQALYWEGMSIEHALRYAYQGGLDKASQLFEETKTKNPRAYYTNIHELSRQFRNAAEKETGEIADLYRARAVSLIEQARAENPGFFYSNASNLREIYMLYEDHPEKKIEVYEEFKRVQDETFWKVDGYSPPFHRLMELYIEESKKNPTYHSKAIDLVNEIRIRAQRFFVKRAYWYTTALYLEGEKNPLQVITILEEAKANLPQVFFGEGGNINTLARLYEDQENFEKAIAVYKSSETTNPELFWNEKYGPLYEDLVRLYAKTGQNDKAIEMCEEAKMKSQEFWEPGWYANGGYTRLITLYTDSGRISEAIAISLEAETKDPNFFNPKSSRVGYIQLASLYSEAGQIDEAINVMLKGQETDEDFWSTNYGDPDVFRLIEIYEKAGQTDKAISTLEEVKNKNPNYWRTDYYKICGLYEKSGNFEKAQQTRTQLIGIYEGLMVTESNSYYASSEKLAQLYIEEKQIPKAIQVLETSKENFTDFPIRNITILAELYAQTGEKEKARLAFQEAINRYKESNHPENVSKVIERAKAQGTELML